MEAIILTCVWLYIVYIYLHSIHICGHVSPCEDKSPASPYDWKNHTVVAFKKVILFSGFDGRGWEVRESFFSDSHPHYVKYSIHCKCLWKWKDKHSRSPPILISWADLRSWYCAEYYGIEMTPKAVLHTDTTVSLCVCMMSKRASYNLELMWTLI